MKRLFTPGLSTPLNHLPCPSVWEGKYQEFPCPRPPEWNNTSDVENTRKVLVSLYGVWGVSFIH